MECNKEEAVRARELAEKKMQAGDYTGGRRLALKAQQLYPEIESLSQLLVVCDVHLSAANKLNGVDIDWYAILQIEHFSDDAIIRKQYKKLAFSLHPDRNKCPGAEAAFKLIGEANRVLTDSISRSIFDSKCRVVRPAPPKVAAANHMNKNPPSGSTHQPAQPQHVGSQSYPQPPQQTFWTCCTSCKVKFQYYAHFRNRMLRCQNCNQTFVARDVINIGGQPPGSSYSNSASQSHRFSNVHGHGNVGPQSNGGGSYTFAGVELRPTGRKAAAIRGDSKMGEAKTNVSNGRTGKRCAVRKWAAGKHAGASAQKRPSPCKENSGGDDDFVAAPSKRSREKRLSGFSEKEMKKPSNSGGELNSEHSSGSAPTAADGSKEEADKKARRILEAKLLLKKTSRSQSIQAKEDEAHVSEKQESNDLDNGNEPESGEEIACPDVQFSDFDKDKSENCFDVNQMWALYDETDSMPRSYAQVKKISLPGFKVLITWLDACPSTKEEKDWNERGFPVSCGMFGKGDTTVIKHRQMFSHQIHCTRGKDKDTFLIYPKKGETWALFKDWDMKLGSKPEKHNWPDSFDFVEIVSDFSEEAGIGVAWLVKVEGFVSIFQRVHIHKVISVCINPSELQRFSHRIPSRMMTGKEAKGVPPGSFEFDTAALPSSLYSFNTKADEVHSSKGATRSYSHYKMEPTRSSLKTCLPNMSEIDPHRRTLVCGLAAKLPDGIRFRTPAASHFGIERDVGIAQPQRPSTSFQAAEKFIPQVKYNNIELRGPVPMQGRRSSKVSSKANVSGGGRNTIPSVSVEDLDMNTSSGIRADDSESIAETTPASSASKRKIEVAKHNFKAERSEDKFKSGQVWAVRSDEDTMPKNYALVKKIESFPSYRLHVALLEPLSSSIIKNQSSSCGTYREGKTVVVPLGQFSHPVHVESIEKNRYQIYPRKGEIWAIYDNSESDRGNGEFRIVEVVESNDSAVKVVTLTALKKFAGFETFYRGPKSRRSGHMMEIPLAEISRFSHQCLAYYHRDVLSGYWELDPSSIPSQVILLE
ncbi:unnamed protein product [Linum trigynum]|uniref:J domain-containing protein n=1 Tax=Linum trigynum TaxID=586398 RepID=A0AAV2E7Z0_9ROSI